MQDTNNVKLKQVKAIYASKIWNDESNKNLLNIISRDKLDLEPCTLYGLDQRGLNNLEIISLSQIIGKKIGLLPTADIDLLNILQEKHTIVFNNDDKQQVAGGDIKASTAALRKLRGYCALPDSSGNFMLGSALFKLTNYYFK